MRRKLILIAPLAVLGMLLFIAIGSVIVQLLWNWLLPPLFGWSHITFWQAFGLLVLCRILFGGFGPGRSVRSNIRQRMSQRWEHMTPEDRETLRKTMLACCGFSSRSTEEPAAGAHEQGTGGS